MEKLNTQEWAEVAERFAALERTPLTPETIQAWLTEWSDLESTLAEASGNAASRAHENTADREAEATHLHYVREILPRVQVAHERLVRRLLDLDWYEPDESQRTMVHRFRVGQQLFREENIPLETEINVLVNEYRKLTGGMTIEWEGSTLTLDRAEGILDRPERAAREEAWRAIHGRWLTDRERLNELFLEMLALRRRIARQAGFADYRAYAWLDRGRFDYEPADALTFHEAIEQEVVPVARRLYDSRKEALSIGEALRPWDLDAETTGRPPLRPFDEIERLDAVCSRIFHAIDPVLGGEFDLLRDGYLDLESRPNKAPGGYCRSLPLSKRSYIFMNAIGQHGNVQTLLHEGGHAFHNQATFDLPLLWQRRAPMEMAEVASMGMELLAHPYLAEERGGFYNERDAARARIQHLEKIVKFLPYMAVVDAFQHWVYSEATEGVTAHDLDRTWGELWDRFMGGIDWSGLEAEKLTGWHRKRHIFVYPFYYIEYGLAQVGALQIWRNALDDQAGALADYRAALALGGTRPLPELFEAAGARFAFDAPTLRALMRLVEQKLDELEPLAAG